MARKGENIYKRKDGRWEARYVKGYTPEGKRKYGYCYARSYRDVKDKASRAKAELISNPIGTSLISKQRFAFFCEEWMVITRSKIKESTYVKYLSMLEKHIKPQLGGIYATALTSVRIEQFEHSLLWEKGLSPKTVHDILSLLSSILKYTAKQIPSMSRIEIAYPKEQKKEIRVLSREEQERLTAFLLTDMDECKFGTLLALMTGLRIGEVCALRWSDICLDEGLIRVRFTMQRIKDTTPGNTHQTKIVITEPKSSKSFRIIPLTRYTYDMCRQLVPETPNAYILTGNNHYVEPRCLQNKLKQYTKACGLAGVHFHTLRHTFATRCVEVDFELKSLSEILGHSSPTVTLERYVHSSLELKRSNMEKLPSLGF